MTDSMENIYQKFRKVGRGDLNGRVARATPVKPYDLQRVPNNASVEVYVQPDEPSTNTVGALWYDTDEPMFDSTSGYYFEDFESYALGSPEPFGELILPEGTPSSMIVSGDRSHSGTKSVKSTGPGALFLPHSSERKHNFSMSSWMYLDQDLEEDANTPDLLLAQGNLKEIGSGEEGAPGETAWVFGAIIGFRNNVLPRNYFFITSGEESSYVETASPVHTGWHRFSMKFENVTYPVLGTIGAIRGDVSVEIAHETYGTLLSHSSIQRVIGGQTVLPEAFPIVPETNSYLWNVMHGSGWGWDMAGTVNTPTYLDDVLIDAEATSYGRLRVLTDTTSPTENGRWPFFSPKGLENNGRGRGKIYVGPPIGWANA